MSMLYGMLGGVVGGAISSAATLFVGLRQVQQMKMQVQQMKIQIDKIVEDKEEDIRIEMRSLLSEIETTYDITQEPAGAEDFTIRHIQEVLAASYLDKIANSSGIIERARTILPDEAYNALIQLKDEAKEFRIDARLFRTHVSEKTSEETRQQLLELQKTLVQVNIYCFKVAEKLGNALGLRVPGEKDASSRVGAS